ncbi:unnamed protein product [Cladocopium goreaui]|uniref:Uncharacterized protein n=1 Tax=Cladocopium goreaui TaxID=2562237 RepID=A0A9P1G632_9DINO|nr:unnamed protein product [Cladocopium goreaui]
MAVQLEVTGKVALQNGLARIEVAFVRASGRGDSTSSARTASTHGRDPSLASSYKPLAVDKQRDWTAEATDQLRSNLAKAKRGAAAMLALENGPPGPPTKKQRLQASSSSSSSSSESDSDSDSSAEPALAASAEPPPAQSDDESPVHRVHQRNVFEQSAIEDENEELKTKNLSLCEENVQLKTENCDLKKTVKALHLQLDGH